MKTQTQPKPRPYWHVDAKWISGIGLFFALGLTLLLFNLTAITDREFATRSTATLVASLFSKEGLDDDSGLAEFRQKVNDTPGDTVVPIPQFPWLTLTKQDALTLGPRELRIKIFSQLTTPIYDKGLDGAAAQFTSNPAEQKEFKKNATLLGLFTSETHKTLKKMFTIVSIVAAVLLAAVIYFSAGWGRLVSPGLLLLVVALPGALFSLILAHPPQDGDAPFAALPKELTDTLSSNLSHSYLYAALLGVFLLVAALIGKTITHHLHRRPPADTPSHDKPDDEKPPHTTHTSTKNPATRQT
jgi:hypothetical protein